MYLNKNVRIRTTTNRDELDDIVDEKLNIK